MTTGNWAPGFIGIGAEKSATTWAWSMLNAHPAIAMSQPKELDFFNRNFDRGLDWYRRHFSEQANVVHGEISPHYMDCPETADRIAAMFPQTRLLVMLRNPFDRAYSHLLHDSQNEYGGVADLTAEQLTRLADRDDKYVRRSCYAKALQPFFSQFPREQIGIFFFDDVHIRPQTLVRRIYQFLQVDETFVPEKLRERINRTQNYRSPLAAKVVQQICRAGRAFGPTSAMLDLIYRRTMLRERVLNLLMVDRGRPEIAPEQVFSAQQLDCLTDDLQRLSDCCPVPLPGHWLRKSPQRAAA